EGITRDILNNWCKQTSWEQILNKRSTTWRVLTVQDQGKITHEKAAIELMITANSLIKRPIIEKDTQLLAIGFDEKQLNRL
ncbi:ArsC/Spx/MgsR family protein, partial [Acinetobacter baumannii]